MSIHVRLSTPAAILVGLIFIAATDGAKASPRGWPKIACDKNNCSSLRPTIRTRINRIGRARYPGMSELRITADCGGSNGARVRLWKVELQKLADTTWPDATCQHYPPGTSKWSKIEHRLFCHITQ